MVDPDELQRHFRQLYRQDPVPLVQSFPGAPGRRAHATLAAWGEDLAADLHARYGDDLDLTVGYLRYPSRTRPDRAWADPRAGVPLADPTLVRVALDGPLTVPSGHSARHRLLISNHGPDRLVLDTNGQVTAVVVDPASGAAVGTDVGAQFLPLIHFTADPGATVAVPLEVGTASIDPDLGYALPPGEWALQVPLPLEGRGKVLTPPLPFAVS